MADYRTGLFLGLTIGILFATSVSGVFLYKNSLTEYCEGNIQALVVLDNQKKGTLYLHCKGTIYQSDLNVSSDSSQSQQISYSGGI